MLALYRAAYQHPGANSAKPWGPPVDVSLGTEKELELNILVMGVQADRPGLAGAGSCWQCQEDGQLAFVPIVPRQR